MQVTSWNDIREERVHESATRKMIWGENVMVTRWELAPLTVFPTHQHMSEQVTIVISGSVTLTFQDREDAVLNAGDMLVIPPSKPHGVVIGPDGAVAMDIFSPIRTDFIEGTTSYLTRGEAAETSAAEPPTDEQKYAKLNGFLRAAGITIELKDLMEVPLVVVARYVYDKECITLGELRAILGLDKKQAKALLREWKHGDDHSESSLKRKLERLVIVPGDLVHPPKRG
ncbi:MAG: cupin domain-containing protein [Desulfomonile tiedjei]|nr:cupin domain-containing protein [Desulfomonile tiedjei]